MSYKWWMLTIPYDEWDPNVPEGCKYIKGQAELGESGYHHWQLVIYTKKCRLSAVKKMFGPKAHIEATRSAAALEYVWKEETRVEGSQFELGEPPVQRNLAKDWDSVWTKAQEGKIMEIPADIRIRSYSTLKRIEKDYMKLGGGSKKCVVYIGQTGMGKSSKAWHESSLDAYPKVATTKFWDGYTGQENIVMDEFRGAIRLEHLLIWLDRYPCCVENKGGGCVLKARKWWITSNVHPIKWYPEIDDASYGALMRRIEVVDFKEKWECPDRDKGCSVCEATK